MKSQGFLKTSVCFLASAFCLVNQVNTFTFDIFDHKFNELDTAQNRKLLMNHKL